MKHKQNGSDSKPNIDVTQIRRVKPQEFVVDLMVDNVPWRLVIPIMDLDCLMASLTVLAASNIPRVGGWNIYSKDEGKLLKSVSTIDFIARIVESTPLKMDPGNKIATAKGYIPAVTPTSEAFQKMIDDAKKAGRIPK